MDTKTLKEQVNTIRQAFGYINRFKGQTFVIKLECSLINQPFFPLLIKDIVLLKLIGIKIVLVPGARQRIDEILKTYSVPTKTIKGVRISDEKAMPFINMAAFDVCNRIMTILAGNNTNAIIGNWVRARGIGVRKGVDYKHSGLVEKLDVDMVNKILNEGLIPIFPNIGWNAIGKPYNLSSNDLATTISCALEASKLFFVTDFGGISGKGLFVPETVYVASDGTISQLTIEEAMEFEEKNKKKCPYSRLELVSLGYQACQRGVKRVHIIDGRIEGIILKEIFSNRGLGTMIYANQFDNIRPMEYNDIPDVLAIMEPLIREEILIPRTQQDIEKYLHDYVVYEVDGTIHGAGALHKFDGLIGEIAGIAVDDTYANLGIGKKIVNYLISQAIKMKLREVFVLTTQSGDWFSSLGFKETSIDRLPKEKRHTYNLQRKSKVFFYKLPRRYTKRHLMAE